MTDRLSNLTPDELLSAFIDGELSGAECARVEQWLEDDPDLMARLEVLRGADATFIQTTDDIATAPMSEGLASIVADLKADNASVFETSSNVAPLRPSRGLWQTLREHRAIAACAAMMSGIFAVQASVGTMQMASNELPANGIVLASSDLYEVLETSVSGAIKQVGDDYSVTPQMSFVSDDGAACRVADLAAQERSGRIVACKSDGNWDIQIASYRARSQEPLGAYQTASGPDPIIETFLDKTMSGGPLSAAQETAAIGNGWAAPATNQNTQGE